MFWLLSWAIYGFIIGLIAKCIHPGDDPIGFLPTIGIGVVGSFIGGFINFLLGYGYVFSTSGLLMSIIGGVIFCWLYSNYKLNRFMEMQKFEIQKLKDQ